MLIMVKFGIGKMERNKRNRRKEKRSMHAHTYNEKEQCVNEQWKEGKKGMERINGETDTGSLNVRRVNCTQLPSNVKLPMRIFD